MEIVQKDDKNSKMCCKKKNVSEKLSLVLEKCQPGSLEINKRFLDLEDKVSVKYVIVFGKTLETELKCMGDHSFRK